MKIIQIIGYKNSGKTTLAAAIINKLAKQGLHIATLKHHGHGGLPQGFKQTDSQIHHQAGSIFTGVQGEHVLQLSASFKWDEDKLLSIYKLFSIDVLIIEGFKSFSFPKIVLLRNEQEYELTKQLTNIIAIIIADNKKINEGSDFPYPIFNKTNLERFFQWLENHLS